MRFFYRTEEIATLREVRQRATFPVQQAESGISDNTDKPFSASSQKLTSDSVV